MFTKLNLKHFSNGIKNNFGTFDLETFKRNKNIIFIPIDCLFIFLPIFSLLLFSHFSAILMRKNYGEVNLSFCV